MRAVSAAALAVAFASLCLAVALRHGPWVDEYFSLAMATGHSLEHPAAAAVAGLGDYVELPGVATPADYSRYLEHDRPPAGPARVARAVLMSDTSPPLYYLALSAWTRALGTGDLALRLFSILWAVATLPLIGATARRLGGRRAVAPALVLFAFAPRSIYYATEGRMYSMLIFLVLATALIALELRRRGPSRGRLALWLAATAAGMLTHYFFVFPWLACLAWLLATPGRCGRGWILGASAAAAACVAPWYARIPESLAGWRVTAGWLEDPSIRDPLHFLPRIPWHFVAAGGGLSRGNRPILVVLALLAPLLAWRGGPWFRAPRLLVWAWLAATLLGPLGFDLLRGTGTLAVPRYAIAGMPALFLLLAAGLARLRREARVAFLVLIVVAWLPGIRRHLLNETRDAFESFGAIGAMLAAEVGPDDLAVVHSIPSGVAGVARAVEAAGGRDVPIASWVGQLGRRRVPGDIAALADGRRRVYLVVIHQVGDPVAEEMWLREHFRLAEARPVGAATVLVFERPDPGGVSVPPAGAAVPDPG